MHPDISELPSRLFYKSKLSDGPEMASKTAALWHTRNVFGPYRFFDVRGQEERQSTSTKNRKEAQVAVQLYKALGQDFGDKINLNMRVGIISMYREQIYEMRRSFMAEFGQEIVSAVEYVVSTCNTRLKADIPGSTQLTAFRAKRKTSLSYRPSVPARGSLRSVSCATFGV